MEILLFLAIASRGQVERSDEENHAQFVEHFHSVLNIGRMASYKVHDSMACALQCMRSTLCYSVNFAVHSDDQGHLCELLPADKYQFPNKFESSASYLHYSIESPCEHNPCTNGATCRPLYGSNGFSCERNARRIVNAAPWLKVSSEKVCFGAKDDSYGHFTIPRRGTIISLKLVYVSGYVSCLTGAIPQGSHWGCRNENELTTLVTNGRNEVIFPRYNDNRSYKLRGYNFNSPELVFNVLSPPLSVATGEEFRIWYRQDLLNGSEHNNAGHTCADVYVLMG
ncbi:hypothetical protein OS493_015131 [Desmophyllum pertusum]|uniref:Uncharacterized protein n=1 Tax=Desmophyllum pertusum TaxID=174260 RepID=A0A9W9ZRE6_9CNID|nr:hypothetical protein OS493_015131 [Desmophyllum pertusum]